MEKLTFLKFLIKNLETFFFQRGAEMSALVSQQQAKLHALLGKLEKYLPFFSDEDCDEAFDVLASLAREAIRVSKEKVSSRFSEMDLEELIQMDDCVEEEKEETKKKTPRKKKKRQNSKTPPRAAHKKQKQDGSVEQGEPKWNFLEYGNVHSIESIDEDEVCVHLLAKPAKAGNHKPKPFHAKKLQLKELAGNHDKVQSSFYCVCGCTFLTFRKIGWRTRAKEIQVRVGQFLGEPGHFSFFSRICKGPSW